VGGEISRTCPDPPWGPPSLCTTGTDSFLGVKSGRGLTLTPHPLLVPLGPYGPYGLYRAAVPLQGCTIPLLYTVINRVSEKAGSLALQLHCTIFQLTRTPQETSQNPVLSFHEFSQIASPLLSAIGVNRNLNNYKL